MKKKIIITGVGGYVGSSIAENFLADGHKIIGFGHDENFPVLREKFGDSVQLVAGDITDEKKLIETLHGADVVIHTASPTTEKFCIEKPWEALQAIMYGTRAVANVMRELKVPLLIHFSTQAVYMNFCARELPLTEEMEPKPDTVYGALKLAAEHELANIPVFILRPANIYGKNPLGIERENVISRFVDAAKKNVALTIKGDGLQHADYVHVRDVVCVVTILVGSKLFDSLPVIYNVGSGVSHSVADIANIVIDAAKQSGFPKPMIQYEKEAGSKIAADRVLSIERMRALLPNFPTVSFEEGVKELFT